MVSLVNDVVWRYLGDKTQIKHALKIPHHGVALCGTTQSWAASGPRWLGDRSKEERDRLAELMYCGRCRRILGFDKPAEIAVSKTPRPQFSARHTELFDWLHLNGVDEWIPPKPQFEVVDGELTYTAYQWTGPRGWDKNCILAGGARGPATEFRTVPLLVEPTDRIRELAGQIGFTLIEARA